MLNAKKGFTLIELLIVIVIIGILAGIVVGIVGTSANAKAKDAKLKANVHEVQNALEQYYIDNGSYPVTTGWAAALVPATGVKYLTGTDVTTGMDYAFDATAGSYVLSVVLNNNAEKVEGNVRAGSGQTKEFFVTSKQQ